MFTFHIRLKKTKSKKNIVLNNDFFPTKNKHLKNQMLFVSIKTTRKKSNNIAKMAAMFIFT